MKRRKTTPTHAQILDALNNALNDAIQKPITCLWCGQRFSPLGLDTHICPAKGSARLTSEEWTKSVLRSFHGPFARRLADGSIVHLTGYAAQLEAVREMPIGNLQLVIAWPQTGRTVRAAAQRRFRGLTTNHPMTSNKTNP